MIKNLQHYKDFVIRLSGIDSELETPWRNRINATSQKVCACSTVTIALLLFFDVDILCVCKLEEI